MPQHILISNINENPVVCFNTGLDPRSFARTKMSQSLIEKGYIVNPDGTHDVWISAGVDEVDGFMRVWGPLFQAKRFDLFFEDIDSPNHPKMQIALQALIIWIKAKIALGETRSAFNPGAAFISKDRRVFFAPEHLANRCLYVEGFKLDRNNCPDLVGMDAAAFCAGVMLYKILTGLHPYPSKEIYQDMREGIFLPVHLASPNLNDRLSTLIKEAFLLPVETKKPNKNGITIMKEILEILSGKEAIFKPLPPEKIKNLEKERKNFLFKQNSYVKTKRFVLRNIIPIVLAVFLIAFIAFIFITSMKGKITTEGLAPEEVVSVYYEAFSELNDQMMKACLQGDGRKGAGKRDMEAAGILLVISRQREYYERRNESHLVTAQVWRDQGGELPSPSAFGVTNLEIERLSKNTDGSSINNDIIVFRAKYSLWSPTDSYEIKRNDVLMLKRDRHDNWRIIDIVREER